VHVAKTSSALRVGLGTASDSVEEPGPVLSNFKEDRMSTRGRISTIPRTAFIVDVAAADAAFWMAGTTAPDVATTSREVEFASIGSPVLSLHQLTAQASSPTPGPLAAGSTGIGGYAAAGGAGSTSGASGARARGGALEVRAIPDRPVATELRGWLAGPPSITGAG
jgi:hypothetical protein